jgi:hypothetical protein
MRVLGTAFAFIGVLGVTLGIARICEGETMHGLANIIVGGLVALYGISTVRDAT